MKSYRLKILIFIFACGFFSMGLFDSVEVQALKEYCVCKMELKGPDCNFVGEEDTFAYGEDFDVKGVAEIYLDDSKCSKTEEIVKAIPLKAVPMSAALCNTASQKTVNLAGHELDLVCKIKNITPAAPTTPTTPAASNDPSVVSLQNPINTNAVGIAGLTEIMGRLIKTAVGIIGSLALVVFFVGGIMWMTAAGNPERVKKGTSTMMWAVIGIIVVFSSYAIITLVFKAIGASDGAAPLNTSTGEQWCLTAEKNCIKSSGGACSGTSFTTEELCVKAK